MGNEQRLMAYSENTCCFVSPFWVVKVHLVSLQASKKTTWRLRRFVKSGFGAVAVAIIFLPVVFGPVKGWTVIKTNTSQVSVEPRFSFAYFGDLANWLGDRVTLKDQAIRVDSKIDRAIFNESASAGSVSPRVLEGEGGVAFIADAFNEACNPHIQTRRSDSTNHPDVHRSDNQPVVGNRGVVRS